jgi:ferredoxin-NADP reductase
MSDPLEPLHVVVTAREPVADGVLSLVLEHPRGVALPPWEPGAHVELHLPNGLVRQYSLCGDVGEPSWRVGVLREPASRGGSAWLHDELAVGAELRTSPPRNNFPLTKAEEYVFIAGGIGVTPLLPMIAAVEADGLPWTLAYGGRTTSSMAFLDRLAAHGDRVRLTAQDTDGLIDLDTLLGAPRDGVVVYCCGPEPLLAAVESRCAAWPSGTLHVERFKPKEGVLDGESTAFEVELAESGVTVTVDAEQSIVDAVEAAGIDVASSCLEGTCGTCETPVLEGTPDHRDSYLTEEEQAAGDVMMICCSRSRGPRLVLDL